MPQLRQGSLAGGSACAVEAPPSSQTASHAACRQGRAGGPRASRDPVLGGKSRTKTRTPENAYGLVELIPRLYHHTKGSSWEHSGGRLERLPNTFRTEVVLLTLGHFYDWKPQKWLQSSFHPLCSPAPSTLPRTCTPLGQQCMYTIRVCILRGCIIRGVTVSYTHLTLPTKA